MAINRPRGTNDFLPEDTAKWQAVEELLRGMCRSYGFQEIRTPIFEDTDLFCRGVGATTDIVTKEMYTFEDHGGRSVTLRPENTASACRAFLENKLYGLVQPTKLYYIGPMFRYEKPQAGRFRQFHQFGLEIFGTSAPAADAEIIAFAWDLYQRLGIQGLVLKLNSVGCPKCRAAYRKALQDYFHPHLETLCGSCRDRFERNPLRILDCKSEICQGIGADAPKIQDYLCEDCAGHFEKVQNLLHAAEIPFVIDPHMVRGLDYYTKTAFEIQAGAIGAQSAVCGGGRYDGLIQEIGGDPTPGVGFALGIERIFAALQAQGDDIEVSQDLNVYILVAGGVEASAAAFRLADQLRRAELSVEMDYADKSFKAQMKAANRLGAAMAVIIGDDEVKSGCATVKDMESGEQCSLPFTEIKQYILER
ncbi:MAG: histidine--tRNA ligase [Bacillota bacterium]|nr:histidine--tRNA ligase [Bacillota bacterium]